MTGEVLIAGAGPVGLACGLTLARHGVAVTVLERGAGLSTASRASTFHAGTLDRLEPLGVVPELVAAGLTVPRVQWRDLAGTVLAEMDLAVLDGLTRHPYRLHAEQTALTRLLAERLQALPHARILFEHEVHRTSTVAGGVEVTARTPDGPYVFAGRYLIAADGAHSAVRTALGLAFPGTNYPHQALRVITEKALDEAIPGLAALTYYRDVRQSFSALGLLDHWRLIFRVPLGGRAADAAGLLRRGLPGVDVPIADAHTYPVSRRLLDSYRHGAVFFAGDAAHLTSTAGGLNMNAGLHDATTLGDTLAEILRGADDDLATRWADRRRSSLVDDVLPQSENRARGADGTDPRAAVAEIVRIAADPALTRDYLARSSLLTPRPVGV
ncbi:FAD-dependent oxidoreductase [Paractinoplanes ferrugineus]|uniref:FAD-dependent oxidoreductase n=1 Tax=Paractinoplanes ferrugineus TaxID=113564 RepID=UPI001940AB99|nr:FAD-dependent monooxygenase [Actinoplanes ferrugineus]